MVTRIVLNQLTAVDCYIKVLHPHGHIIYRILLPAFATTPLSPRANKIFAQNSQAQSNCDCSILLIGYLSQYIELSFPARTGQLDTGILSNGHNEASHHTHHCDMDRYMLKELGGTCEHRSIASSAYITTKLNLLHNQL
eukprot:scaffold93715_cov78-Attheya_sp.AAC.1